MNGRVLGVFLLLLLLLLFWFWFVCLLVCFSAEETVSPTLLNTLSSRAHYTQLSPLFTNGSTRWDESIHSLLQKVVPGYSMFWFALLHLLNIQLVKCSHGKIYTARVFFLVWPFLVNLTDRKTTTLENIYPSSGFPHPSWKPQDKDRTKASKTKICTTS